MFFNQYFEDSLLCIVSKRCDANNNNNRIVVRSTPIHFNCSRLLLWSCSIASRSHSLYGAKAWSLVWWILHKYVNLQNYFISVRCISYSAS